jgi:hypothetical protein
MKPAPRLSRTNPEPAYITAASLVPPRGTIPILRKAASACTACDLWRTATQTVFGEGKSTALIRWWESSQGFRKIVSDDPSLGQLGNSSMRRWPRLASIAPAESSLWNELKPGSSVPANSASQRRQSETFCIDFCRVDELIPFLSVVELCVLRAIALGRQLDDSAFCLPRM